MPALYTITTRASGTILTAAIYNTDHQNHVNNGDAQHLGGFSANTSQMRTQTSPGDVGTESLSLSISDELARIRYMIALQRGTTFWYGTAASYPGSSVNNYIRNSNFLVAQRMGQTSQAYVASAGSPYTFDQWYAFNGANQSMYLNYAAGMFASDLASASFQRQPGQTGTGQMWLGQPFTLAQLAPLCGKQVTCSVYFATTSTFSSPSIVMQLTTGTGTAGKWGTFVGIVNVLTATISTTASMGVTLLQGTGVVPANASQMELRLITNPTGTAGAGDAIQFARAKLEVGAQVTPYIPPDPYAELMELSSWYWKSFPLGILPQSNAGLSGALVTPQIGVATTGSMFSMLRWPTRMIKPPTVITYNPSAAGAQARNITVNADCTATAATNIDESGAYVNMVTAVGSAATNQNAIHVTADGGL